MTDRPHASQSYLPREYQSYLLRLWRTAQGESVIWRASLENTRTGQWHSFADLSAAFTFLDAQTAHSSASREGDSDQPHTSMTEKHHE